jgi:hypothetical protein
MTPEEIARELSNKWIDPDWEITIRRKGRE